MKQAPPLAFLWCAAFLLLTLPFALLAEPQPEPWLLPPVETTAPEAEESATTPAAPTALEEYMNSPMAALTVHEPMYIVAGSGQGEDIKARFQFSFKYRLFDENTEFVQRFPLLGRLHLSYTQTSLWNWSAQSVPFEDTSYKPSLFFELLDTPVAPMLNLGYYHESNGEDGDDSRSMDTLFVQPVWGTQLWGRDFYFIPRALVYLTKGDENRDLTKYRGHVDYLLRYGNEDGLVLSSLYRYGYGGRHTVQMDASYPLRMPIAWRTGGFVFAQAFSGYGESMLTYNERVDFTLRIGLGIVR